MQLSKGQNTTLPNHPVMIAVSWPGVSHVDADLSALLLADGCVRSDDDFVFYNQPGSPDGSVTHTGKTRTDGVVTDTLVCTLSQADPAIDAVAVSVSVDGPAAARLADLGELAVEAAVGTETFTFIIDDLSDETAAVAVELYRRDGRWKLRAVGQGYRDGLAGLARDFGVTVEDETTTPIPDPVADSPADWRNPSVPAGYEI
ncbi:TerD family protein [Rhodococcus marinonascens]|uniref:TerD family protein n=1 Tax=Rhodococcus marinonascens TaxID=38311 RepID=UPI0009345C65|nr:TerD family protein [Rhodococcus marinonascens]